MGNTIGGIEEIGRRGEEELSVEWEIPKFPSLLHETKDSYWSPEFRLREERWRLTVYPNWQGEAGNPASGWVRLDLERFVGGPAATFCFSAGIRGSGGVEKRREGEKEFKDYDNYYHWDDFCSRSYLLEHRTRLMPKDTLTVSCDLKRLGTASGVCSLPCPSSQVAPTDTSQSSDKRGQQSSNKCVICLEGSVDTALSRCGHMYTCYDCALKLWKSNSLCPICRKPIQDILKIYSDYS